MVAVANSLVSANDESCKIYVKTFISVHYIHNIYVYTCRAIGNADISGTCWKQMPISVFSVSVVKVM